MRLQDLFNKDSICIFTDSSFKNESKDERTAIGTTAPAVVIYNDIYQIAQKFHILHNSTTQQGELYAILLGVMEACKYRQYKHVRLFSDSQVSIFGIRDRIFKWVRETHEGKNILGDDGCIKNQDFIMNIVYTILANNVPIEFYHVKGHVKKNYNDIVKARDLFKLSNNIQDYVEDWLIYFISDANNTVDRYSTQMLNENIYNPIYDVSNLTPALTIGYADFDIRKYYDLVS